MECIIYIFFDLWYYGINIIFSLFSMNNLHCANLARFEIQGHNWRIFSRSCTDVALNIETHKFQFKNGFSTKTVSVTRESLWILNSNNVWSIRLAAAFQIDTKIFNIPDFKFWLLQLIEPRLFESNLGSKEFNS
jgi:hypothetical protein